MWLWSSSVQLLELRKPNERVAGDQLKYSPVKNCVPDRGNKTSNKGLKMPRTAEMLRTLEKANTQYHLPATTNLRCSRNYSVWPFKDSKNRTSNIWKHFFRKLGISSIQDGEYNWYRGYHIIIYNIATCYTQKLHMKITDIHISNHLRSHFNVSESPFQACLATKPLP